jgi:hypothetical protein
MTLRTCRLRSLVLSRFRYVPVTGNPRPATSSHPHGYDVNVPAMSWELHEWDIHIE